MKPVGRGAFGPRFRIQHLPVAAVAGGAGRAGCTRRHTVHGRRCRRRGFILSTRAWPLS